jgi:hypothetical protein
MAQAVDHHNEFTLDDYHHHVRMVLGCGINAAVREMERRIATGQSLLLCQEYDADNNPKGDAYVINRRDFSTKYNLKFDMSDRLRVVPRTLKSMFGGGKPDPSDPFGPAVERIGGLPKWMDDFDYTVVEQDVRSSPPPATLPAPDQQPENKAGPDPPKPSSTIVWATAEAGQLKAGGKITKTTSKTKLADLLAQQSQGAAKARKLKKPLTLRYIRNQLEAWGLWPISSIK